MCIQANFVKCLLIARLTHWHHTWQNLHQLVWVCWGFFLGATSTYASYILGSSNFTCNVNHPWLMFESKLGYHLVMGPLLWGMPSKGFIIHVHKFKQQGNPILLPFKISLFHYFTLSLWVQQYYCFLKAKSQTYLITNKIAISIKVMHWEKFS